MVTFHGGSGRKVGPWVSFGLWVVVSYSIVKITLVTWGLGNGSKAKYKITLGPFCLVLSCLVLSSSLTVQYSTVQLRTLEARDRGSSAL